MSSVLFIDFPSSDEESVRWFLTERGFNCLPTLPLIDDSHFQNFFGKNTADSERVDIVLIYLSGDDLSLKKTHLFLNKIRETNSTACVILSGNPIPLEALCVLLRGGAYDYLSAPISLEKLQKSIEQGLKTKVQAEDIIVTMSLANERLLEEKARLQLWNHDLTRICQMNHAMTSFLNPSLTISAFSEALKSLIPYQFLSILLKGKGSLDRVWVFPEKDGDAQREYAKEEGELLREAFFRCQDSTETKSSVDGHEVIISLMAGAEKLGILRIVMGMDGTLPFPLKDYHVKILLMVATSLSLSLRNAEMYQQVKELAVTDELTHVLNRRAFLNILERELKRANRLETTLTLFIVDLDHFKQINDLYGHITGDFVLQEIAALLRGSIREIDVMARYGGEEFVVILPEVDQKEAAIAAERIRHLVEFHLFRKEKEAIRMTVSIGMAVFPGSRTKNPEDLFHLADVALYLAKKKGRNRIEVSPPDVEDIKQKKGEPKTSGRVS
jgi:diguanylate cyclase (GGDEF)-like protein